METYANIPQIIAVSYTHLDVYKRQAPAVCELDGPIMFGPSTSNTLINDIKVPPVLFVDAHIEVVYLSLIHI